MPPKIEEIPAEEAERLVRLTGLSERLPADFIPFDPAAVRSQAGGSSDGGYVQGMRPSDFLRQRGAGVPKKPSEKKTSPASTAKASDTPAPEWLSSEEESGSEDESQDEYGEDGSQSGDPAYSGQGEDDDEPPIAPFIDKMLDTIIWTLPFAFVFLLLDIMIQQQFALHPTFLIELGRLLGTIPLLTAFIWATSIRKITHPRALQLFFFLISVVVGSSFLWIYAKSDYTIVVRRSPPLGTLWIYTIVKLDLLPSVVSLGIVYGFVRWHALRLLG